MMSFSRLSLLPAVVLFAASSVLALPVVSVDVDPSTAGVQSVLDVSDGDSFSVDVVISGVDASTPVQGFQFNLGFDPAVLTVVSAADGDFLAPPVFSLAQDLDNAIGDVFFASITLGTAGASSQGILATLGFEAGASGASVLDLFDVTLLVSTPSGEPIPIGQVDDASVRVAADETVSEPRTLAVMALGLVGLAAFGRRRKTKRP
jgi:MYXO-CTERM domain-containing protein